MKLQALELKLKFNDLHSSSNITCSGKLQQSAIATMIIRRRVTLAKCTLELISYSYLMAQSVTTGVLQTDSVVFIMLFSCLQHWLNEWLCISGLVKKL